VDFEPVYNRPEAPGKVWSVKCYVAFELTGYGARPIGIWFVVVAATADGATQRFERLWQYIVEKVKGNPFDSDSILHRWLDLQRLNSFVRLDYDLEPYGGS
jgi:hypothetical protein